MSIARGSAQDEVRPIHQQRCRQSNINRLQDRAGHMTGDFIQGFRGVYLASHPQKSRCRLAVIHF